MPSRLRAPLHTFAKAAPTIESSEREGSPGRPPCTSRCPLSCKLSVKFAEPRPRPAV